MNLQQNIETITKFVEQNPKQAIKNLALGYIGYKFVKFTKQQIKKKNKQRQYQRQVDQYLKERKVILDELKQKVENYDLNLSEEVIEQILDSSVKEIQQLLIEGVVTSVQLLYLFTKRTLTIGLEHNAITDTNFDEALKQAEYCDNLRKTNPEQCKGDLFGMIVSIKDNIEWKGTRTTLGAASNINRICEEDGTLVTILKKAGAVLFVKSNVPQFMMTYETVNYIYGHCLNPWDKSRTPGGSSGGESSLVASRCSPFGIGSDIGGSIRIPCAFTGITGFKAGNSRITYSSVGKHIGYYCPTVIKANAGPMAKFVEDNAIYLRTVLDEKFQNGLPVTKQVQYPLQPFNEEIYNSKKKLRIGYIKSYEPYSCSIAQQRAVDIAVQALKEQGHELIEMSLSPEMVVELRNVYGKIAFGDGLEEFIEAAKDEKLLPFYTFFITLFTQITPRRPLKWLLQTLLRLKGDTDTAVVIGVTKKLSVLEYKVAQGQVKQLEKKILQLLFEDKNIDIMLQPTTNVPSLKLSCSTKDRISTPALYTYIWNMIPLPIGAVPVGVVNKDEQHYDNAALKGMQTEKIKQHMKGTEGLPLSVSVFGPHLSEELCLNVMKQIEEKVKFYENHFKKI